jgi:hypothetical protein
MPDLKALIRVTLIGAGLQVAMVLAGHFVAWIALHVFMAGGLAISALTGFLYAYDVARGYANGMIGGTVSGGLCALIGIAISVALGDTEAGVLVFGTLGSCVAGALAGAVGQLSARGPRPAGHA